MSQSLATKETLLQTLHANGQRFNTLVGRASDADQERPFTAEGWSIKDFLAHMTLWKRAAHVLIVAQLHDQPLPPPIPEGDEANARQQLIDKTLPLADVQNDWMSVHTHITHVLQIQLNDDLLTRPIRVPWSEHQSLPIGSLIESMCEHDTEHFDLIEEHVQK